MHKWLILLRAFFPSWIFFDQVGSEFSLYVRLDGDPASKGEWTSALPPISRTLTNILISPRGNFLHASHNLLNQLAADLSEIETGDEVAGLTSYRLVKNLAEFQLREKLNGRSDFHFQFRLCVKTNGFIEPMLESVVYEARG